MAKKIIIEAQLKEDGSFAKTQQKIDKMNGTKIDVKAGISGLSGLDKTASSAKKLSNILSETAKFDQNGKLTQNMTKFQTGIGKTTTEILKMNEAGDVSVQTIEKQTSALSKYESQRTKQENAINRISKLSNQKYADVIDKNGLSKQKSIIESLTPGTLEFDGAYAKASRAITKYEVSASNASFAQKKLATETKATAKEVADSYKAETLKNKAAAKAEKDQIDNVTRINNLKRTASELESKNLSKFIDKDYLSSAKTGIDSLDSKNFDYAKYKQLDESLKNVKSSAGKAKYEQDQLTQANKKNLLSMDNIKESMGTAAIRTVEWAASMGVLYGTFNAVKSMVSTSTAIADQMTSIKMVTGASDSEIKSMLGTYQTLATDLSSTTSQVAASAEVWVRQGRSISDTNDLIKTSTVLSKVGFMDSATSAQLLTSSINGYGIAAKDAMSVVDKMSAIDVNAATSTEDLAVAMAQTASGAKIAGVSMDELLSYVATISDVTQASGDTIGVSLKTMFARINSVKLGSLTDDEGQDISRVETVLKQYGITLRETNGTAKDTGDILDELSTKWGSLTGLEKSEIAMQMAGVHQKEKFLVLMENYNKALKYQDIAANSAGSAMQKMSIWETTTQAATQRLTNQWEIMSTKMVDSNFTKAIINLGTLSLTALNTDLGQTLIKVSMIASALLAVGAVKGKITSGWGAIDVASGSGMLVNIKKITEAQKAYKASLTGVKVEQELFATGSLASTVANTGLANALKGVAIAAAPFVVAFAAVAGGLAVADAITVSYGEHMKNISDSKTKISDNKSEIDNITNSLQSNSDKIKEIKNMGTISVTDQQELTRLEISNQQLKTKKEALEAINKVTAKNLSDESITTMNARTVNSVTDTAGLDKMGLTSPTKISTVDSLKEQMQQVQDVENKIAELHANRKQYTDDEYVKQYDNLTKKQKEYSQSANQTALTLNDLASSIDGSTKEGKDQLAVIDDLNKQLLENNKLIDGSSTTDVKTNAEVKSSFNGAQAEDYSKMGGYISNVESGLASGLTENTAYKESLMTLFSDVNPPDDVQTALESLKVLFSEDDAYAGQFLETVNGFKTESGNFDLKSLQDQFHLSDTAIATVNSRLEEMGLLMSSSAADGVWNLGNGLGLASDDSTEFEMQLNKMSKSVKDGGSTFQEAESYIRDYLGTLGVTGGKIEQVVDDFSMLKQGANDSNLLAFTGLTGEGELSDVSNQAESLASNYVTTFKDYFQSEMSKGTKIQDIKMDLGFGVSADGLKDNIAQVLTDTGLFAEDQVQQMAETISNNTINTNFNIVAEGIISQLNIQDSGVQDQIRTILQSHFNADTQTFDIPAITAEVSKINVEGFDASQVSKDIAPMLTGVQAEMTISAKTDAAAAATTEITKPENKTITAVADTGAAAAAIAELTKTDYKTIIVNEQQGSTVNVSDTTKTVYVQEVAAAGNVGSLAAHATGHISLNTQKDGTESVVGEEGEEALIRNGKVSFIGTNGAEVIPIRDGDTILPADVTKKIKSGQIPMYAEGKYAVSITGNSMASTVANYKDSGNYNGLGDDAPEDEEAKKAYDAHKKAFDKEIAYAKHLRDMDEIDEAEYYRQLDSINERYFANRSDFLDEYRDHEAEVYEYLKKQEKERLENVKDSYDSSSDYVLDMLDKQIDKLKDEEDLKEKQEKVNNLKANKNQRVYYEGRGWVWEADQTKIAEAQKDVKDDSASAKLKEYRDKWAEIADNYKNEQNKIEAIANLGDDFEKKVLSGDLNILRDFATKYSDVLGDVDSNDGDTSVPLIDYANAWKEEVAKTLTENSSGGILTTALSNSLMGGASTLSTLANRSSSNETNINISNINLENVTDFDSFITEAKQYARVNSPK